METIRMNTVVKKDGEITMTGLPYRRGEQVEMILRRRASVGELAVAAQTSMTAGQLLRSGLIGLWKERQDIPDSLIFARQLRELAQRRSI